MKLVKIINKDLNLCPVSGSEEHTIRLYHLLLPLTSPIIAILLIMTLASIGETQVPAGPPFQSTNTSSAGLYNVIVIIIIMLAATYLIYRLIKRGVHKDL